MMLPLLSDDTWRRKRWWRSSSLLEYSNAAADDYCESLNKQEKYTEKASSWNEQPDDNNTRRTKKGKESITTN